MIHELSSQRMLEVFNSLDANGDGRISKDELRRGLKVFQPTMTQAHLDQIFGILDANGDGFVSPSEFRVLVLRISAAGQLDLVVRRAFDAFDLDGDGQLALPELERLVQLLGLGVRVRDLRDWVGAAGKVNYGEFASLLKGR